MNPWTRFAIILSSLLILSIAVFFLSGLTFVRKNHFVIVKKNGHFFGSFQAGRYYFLPWLYTVSNAYSSQSASYSLKAKNAVLSFQGKIIDPEIFSSQEKNAKKKARELLLSPASNNEISLQIKAELIKSGWEIDAISIER